MVSAKTKKTQIQTYVQGAFYGIFICGIRNLRVFFGPLPVFLCQSQVGLTKMVLWFGVVIIVMVTMIKFMFICVWKSMRTMNDDLMVRIAVRQALLSSIVIGSLVKFRAQVSSSSILMLKVKTKVSFSSCQQNFIKTFQIEGMIVLITKMTLIFSSDLLNDQKQLS